MKTVNWITNNLIFFTLPCFYDCFCSKVRSCNNLKKCKWLTCITCLKRFRGFSSLLNQLCENTSDEHKSLPTWETMYLEDKFLETEMLCWQRVNGLKCYRYCQIVESITELVRTFYKESIISRSRLFWQITLKYWHFSEH